MSDTVAQNPVVYDKVPPAELSNPNVLEVPKGTDDDVASDQILGAGFGDSDSSARKIFVKIINNAGVNLFLTDSGKANDSCWEGFPPPCISKGDTQQFRVDSDGLFAGAHGCVRYNFENDESKAFFLQFDNPYIGTNSYNYKAPWKYGCVVDGGQGKDVHVSFKLVSLE